MSSTNCQLTLYIGCSKIQLNANSHRVRVAILEKSADPLFFYLFLAVTITYQRRALDCVVSEFSAEHGYNIAK